MQQQVAFPMIMKLEWPEYASSWINGYEAAFPVIKSEAVVERRQHRPFSVSKSAPEEDEVLGNYTKMSTFHGHQISLEKAPNT